MEPHVTRMVDERTDLHAKWSKASAFFSTETFKKLDPIDQALLHAQVIAMKWYLEVLNHRIGRAGFP